MTEPGPTFHISSERLAAARHDPDLALERARMLVRDSKAHLKVLAIAAGILFSTPVFKPLKGWIEKNISSVRPKAAEVLSGSIGILNTLALAVLFYASVLFLAAGAYNPFIYFRF